MKQAQVLTADICDHLSIVTEPQHSLCLPSSCSLFFKSIALLIVLLIAQNGILAVLDIDTGLLALDNVAEAQPTCAVTLESEVASKI
jgi:hypothetical protein